MLNWNVPAFGWKDVASRKTFDFGFKNECQGWGIEVRQGRLFEKTKRRINFFESKKIVKS